MEKPSPELGDILMSPLFNRVSSLCPVLHLFGHVYLPPPPSSVHQGDDALLTGGGGAGGWGSSGTGAAAASPSPLKPSASGGSSGHYKNNPQRNAPPGGCSSSFNTSAAAMQQYTSCVHVHGVYPYFMVPQYNREVSAAQFGAQLETVAIRVFNASSTNSNRRGQQYRQTQQLIHDVEVVERTPFYGYHEHPYRFYKVSVIDPSTLRRILDLLRDTTEVGGRTWQLYEAHSPFHIQFMIDYDVKGITPFTLPKGHVRLPTIAELSEAPEDWLSHTAGLTLMHADELPRMTRAAVEMDVGAADLRRLHAGSEPGENLAHMRRLIKQYFAENGVSDALRVASTISTEEKQQDAWRRRGPDGASGGFGSLTIRYGSVPMIQRCDAAARAMRRTMLGFLKARDPTTADAAAAAGAISSKVEAEVKLQAPVVIKQDESSRSTRMQMPKVASYLGTSPGRLSSDNFPLWLTADDRASMGSLVKHNDEAEEGETPPLCTYELLDALAAPFIGPKRHESSAACRLGSPSDREEENVNNTPSKPVSVPLLPDQGETDPRNDTVKTATECASPLTVMTDTPLEAVCDMVDEGEDEDEDVPLLSWGDGESQSPSNKGDIPSSFSSSAPCSPGTHYEVGDSIAWLAVRQGGATGTQPSSSSAELRGVLCAWRVVALHVADGTASVQRYQPLSDTHLAADENTLVRNGSWLHVVGPTASHADIITQLGEVLWCSDETEVVPLSTLSRKRTILGWFITPVPLFVASTVAEYEVKLAAAEVAMQSQQDPPHERVAMSLCRYRYSLESRLFTRLNNATGRDSDDDDNYTTGHVILTSQPARLALSVGSAPIAADSIALSNPFTRAEGDDEGDDDDDDGEQELLSCSSSESSSWSSVDKDRENEDKMQHNSQWLNAEVRAMLMATLFPNTTLTLNTPTTTSAVLPSHSAMQTSEGGASEPIQITSQASSSSVAECVHSSAPSVVLCTGNPPPQTQTQRMWYTHSRCGCDMEDAKTRNIFWCQTRECGTVHISSGPQVVTEAARLTDEGEATPALPGRRCTSSSVPYYTHVCRSAGEKLKILPPPPAAKKQQEKKGQPTHQASCRSTESRQQFTLCALRVVYIEVLIRRTEGLKEIAGDEVLAVGIGHTDSSSETVSVQLYGVRATPSAAASSSSAAAAAGKRTRRRKSSFKPPGGVKTLSGSVQLLELSSEAELLVAVCKRLRELDPDLLISWEGFKFGLGFFALRYRTVLRRSLAKDLSRFGPMDDDLPDLANPLLLLGAEEVPSQPVAVSPAEEEGEGVCSSMSDNSGAEDETDQQQQQQGFVPQAPTTEQYTKRFGASVHIAGRVCRSLGKDLRKEIKMPSYSLPMVHQQIFGQPLPCFSDVSLAKLYNNYGSPGDRHTALCYLLTRVCALHRVAQHVNYFSKTREFSCMYGILFEEVLTRGSQFRVEASLLRMARPQNYVMLSPSRTQVLRQPRISCVPLIMQPKSNFYRDDPVVVLDFRSLYPSVAIAYNLCYSTCVGLVQEATRSRLGVLPGYKLDDAVLRSVVPDGGDEEDCQQYDCAATISPNGAMFVRPCTRRGVLPQLLTAILDTRFEAQAAYKHVAQPRSDAYMQQRLQEQQQALKMLANVTYGYTAASFSGRMPCVDLAEAIVSLGRQTTERAIALIHGNPKWRAEVVYGDTDSVFVRLAGRTRLEAFDIGEEIAQAVTAANPVPIQLQFEKVFFPCMLLVKKRYVGYAWSRRDQTEPVFMAKGIETVRRDQCAATASLANVLLRKLFDGNGSQDELRAAYYHEVGKLQRGDVNPWDCIFRRAVKLGRYRDDSHLPLGARLALRRMEHDLSYTPYWGERLPYIVACSTSSEKLRDQVVHPESLLFLDSHAVIDTNYYIQRHINPTLDRMFYLIGISFANWFATMPRKQSAAMHLLDSKTFIAMQVKWLERKRASASPPGTITIDLATTPYGKRSREDDKTTPPPPPCIVEVLDDSTVESKRAGGSKRYMALDDSVGYGSGDDNDGGTTHHEALVGVRRNTLDSYYPRTRCVVCETSIVTVDQQMRFLQRYNTASGTSSKKKRGSRRHGGGDNAVGGVPPICEACWSDPFELMLRVTQRSQRVGQRLHALHRRCLRCMACCGDAEVADMEDLPAAMPYDRAVAVSEFARDGGNTIGCVSTDCEVTFDKRRLTILWHHLTQLESFLRKQVVASNTPQEL